MVLTARLGSVRRLFLQVSKYSHHFWLVATALALKELWQLANLASLNRASLQNNRRFLEIIQGSTDAVYGSVLLMSVSLLFWRRQLKFGLVRRIGPRWQRVSFGLLVPLAVPFFWMRDVERLASAPRNVVATKESLRMWKPKKTTFLWLLLFVAWARVSGPLDSAALGITYVTEGTSALDDPLRYALKWVDPVRITGALDQYSRFIWLGCVANCLLVVIWSISSWVEMRRLSRLAKGTLH